MAKKQPRGIRNNNPGNIDYNSAVKWQGLANPPREPEGRFCVFAAPKWGIRAIARLLITYQDQYDLNTVRGIINRWAPPSENDSDAYVRAVAKGLGVGPDDPIDVHTYEHSAALVRAIIQHENGQQPYSPEEIDEGLKLAGVVNTARKAPTAGTVGVATGAAATASTAGITYAAYTEIKDTARTLRDQGEAQQSATLLLVSSGLSLVALLVLGAAGYFLWRKARASREH